MEKEKIEIVKLLFEGMDKTITKYNDFDWGNGYLYRAIKEIEDKTRKAYNKSLISCFGGILASDKKKGI